MKSSSLLICKLVLQFTLVKGISAAVTFPIQRVD